MIGIATRYVVPANIAKTSSAALQTTGLTSPIAAGQSQKLRWWVPITVGATGGVRFFVAIPAAVGAIAVASYLVLNSSTGSALSSVEVAAPFTAQTYALANAGNHQAVIEVDITNGAVAGNIDLQFAQNTSDPLTLTLRAGAWLEVISY